MTTLGIGETSYNTLIVTFYSLFLNQIRFDSIEVFTLKLLGRTFDELLSRPEQAEQPSP
jgi:hypothetical protein